MGTKRKYIRVRGYTKANGIKVRSHLRRVKKEVVWEQLAKLR